MADVRELSRRFYEEVLSEGRLDVIEELCSPNYRRADPAPVWLDTVAEGRDQVVADVTALRTAFPDLSIAIEDSIVEENRVATRIRLRGTHLGRFLDIDPTGKRIDVEMVDFLHYQGGKAVEQWGMVDLLEVRRQLGAG